jgi:hypothetical protein
MRKAICILSIFFMGFTVDIGGSRVTDNTGTIHGYMSGSEQEYSFSDNFNIANTTDPTINSNWAKSTGEVNTFTANISSNTLYITNGDNDSLVYYTGDTSIVEPTAQIACNPGSTEIAGLVFSADVTGNTGYTVEIRNGTGNGLRVGKREDTGGTITLVTYTFTPDSGYYNIKADLTRSGTISYIRAKYWDVADSEPADWQINTSHDSAIIADGNDYCGVFASWGDNVNFDNYSITWTE